VGNPKDTLGLWKRVSVPVGSLLLGNMEGRSFLRLLREKKIVSGILS
jgi:hypothetical protein